MPQSPIGIAVPTVLLPAAHVDASRWAVIACDQFTSEPEYWEQVEQQVGDAPSTLRMILPELYLNSPDVEERIAKAQSSMQKYLAGDVMDAHEAFVYVERQVGERTRRGLVVALDLEAYDYSIDSTSLVRATEGTVLDRIPPRMKVRRGAALEMPHIMVLFDDPTDAVLGEVMAQRDALPVAYDTELMLGSGHITGRLVTDANMQQRIMDALAALIEPQAYRARYGLDADHPLLFAMGDGNHSLATAKAVWEELKAAGASDDHPARFALVELVNMYDESMEFEPIHRVLFDATGLVDALKSDLGEASYTPVTDLASLVTQVAQTDAGQRFGIIEPDGYTLVEVARPTHELAVGTLQAFLDVYVGEHGTEIDYVHGDDVVDKLGRTPSNVGFVLPGIAKDAFFRSIAVDGALPRKTFSIGHAVDKRFYLEARRIDG